MKSTLAILIILHAIVGSMDGQSRKARSNLVKIRTNLPQGEGLGLIYYEQDDTLYILTARQVLFDDDATPAEFGTVTFSNTVAQGGIIWRSYESSYAVYKIRKPPNYRWSYWANIGSVTRNKDIVALDTGTIWNKRPQLKRGVVVRAQENSDDFDVRFENSEANEANVLFSRNSIVGITTRKTLHTNSMHIGSILSTEKYLLDVKDSPLYSPAFGIGVTGGTVVPTLSQSYSFSYNYGAYAYGGVTKWLFVRYGLMQYNLMSATQEKEGTDYRFQNEFIAHQVLLNFNMESSLVLNQATSFILGYWRVTHDPRLQVDGGTWQPYDQVIPVDVKHKSGAFSFGFTHSMITPQKAQFTVQFLFTWPGDRYLWVNPAKSLDEGQGREMFAELTLSVGFAKLRDQAEIKFLREKRWWLRQ